MAKEKGIRKKQKQEKRKWLFNLFNSKEKEKKQSDFDRLGKITKSYELKKKRKAEKPKKKETNVFEKLRKVIETKR